MEQRKSIFWALALLIVWAPGAAFAEFVFTAPPRESAEVGKQNYQPIAEYLTRATGETFVYQHPGTWTNYTKQMQAGAYDVIFDGPHFVSWRTENAQHSVLARLPQAMVWTIVARKDDDRINDVNDLIARRVCAPPSPNFGRLTLWTHFPNPVREPVHVITLGWKDGYQSLITGKCHAAIMPATNYEMYDPERALTKVLKTHEPRPNQAFTAGPRINPQLKQKIRFALLSPEGQEATDRLRARYAKGKQLIPTRNQEYAGVSTVLEHALGWGIYSY